jgi:dienelactone hydrolase
MWKVAIGLAICLGAALHVPAANAQFARQEVLAFESANMPIGYFLTGKKGTPVTLAGHLRLPKANEKNSVVILLHGAGGLGVASANVNEWTRVLNEAGIGTFAVDSYSGRGVTTLVGVALATVADTGPINPATRVVDAYRALGLLSKHPLIDANKIAVMGFSHGGPAALYSSMARFRKLHGDLDMRFAAHVSVYGMCETTFNEDEVLDRSPVLLLHGTADDWVPIAPCREYASRLGKTGMNVRLIEYPDANHTFDSPAAREPIKLPQVLTSRTCRFTEVDGASLVNVATKQPLSASDPCFERGVTLLYNETAANKAHEDVKAFLKDAFAQK